MSISQIEIEPEQDNALKSFLLEAADCRVEIVRSKPNCWRVNVTEPDGTVNEIIFSADSEISASILS